MTHTSTHAPEAVASDARPSVLVRKVVPVMWKVVLVPVCAFGAAFGAEAVGLDTANPVVFVGAVLLGIVFALWLTWGDGKEQSE